jgi:hypothetical protein
MPPKLWNRRQVIEGCTQMAVGLALGGLSSTEAGAAQQLPPRALSQTTDSHL